MRAKVRVTLGLGEKTEVVIDNFDVTDIISEMSLTVNPRDQLPILTLEIPVIEDTRLDGMAQVYLGYGVEELLVKWGWTPPEPGKGIRSE